MLGLAHDFLPFITAVSLSLHFSFPLSLFSFPLQSFRVTESTFGLLAWANARLAVRLVSCAFGCSVWVICIRSCAFGCSAVQRGLGTFPIQRRSGRVIWLFNVGNCHVHWAVQRGLGRFCYSAGFEPSHLAIQCG